MLPGYRLPVTYKIEPSNARCPHLLGIPELDWQAETLPHREVWVLRFIESITNKSEWWEKVSNPDIALKWKQDAVGMPGLERLGGFTEEMAEACLIELRRKAELYEKTGLIPVMDCETCVVKSDSLLDDDLRNALCTAVALLEDVPESQKDWHPGSDGKVLNLVDPSLWPLVYGLSRILPDKRISLDNCLEYCGSGSIIPDPDRPDILVLSNDFGLATGDPVVSDCFQWLPFDVNLTGDKPRIESYINNLHPVRHANLYPIIERFIEKSLPAWDVVYRSVHAEFDLHRFDVDIEYDCTVPDVCKWGCDAENRRWAEDENEGNSDDLDDGEKERLDNEWYEQTHPLRLPYLRPDVDEPVTLSPKDVKKMGFFDDAKQIQVIVKLTNIQLTPEKPNHGRGVWHTEGQFNERICATALYYYDCDNITESHVAFRASTDQEDLYELEVLRAETEEEVLERLFAYKDPESKLQELGSVLTRQGRALFIPNVYQQRAGAFQLVDKTRPGHCKILALFLVDPKIPIISTSNVPPQQYDWWTESIGDCSALPTELWEMVWKYAGTPITEKYAKELRKELMAERIRVETGEADSHSWREQWNYCER
ncbi:hypothetical protein BKA56DRAFT_498126 [Ilyonectria sp. MPI-CAGE-AT-0026]|nr:hypothetical protein BKA56DRAFT_498126 [Ilyonectria sp. MPI-CAGE-AT-0026]